MYCILHYYEDEKVNVKFLWSVAVLLVCRGRMTGWVVHTASILCRFISFSLAVNLSQKLLSDWRRTACRLFVAVTAAAAPVSLCIIDITGSISGRLSIDLMSAKSLWLALRKRENGMALNPTKPDLFFWACFKGFNLCSLPSLYSALVSDGVAHWI